MRRLHRILLGMYALLAVFNFGWAAYILATGSEDLWYAAVYTILGMVMAYLGYADYQDFRKSVPVKDSAFQDALDVMNEDLRGRHNGS